MSTGLCPYPHARPASLPLLLPRSLPRPARRLRPARPAGPAAVPPAGDEPPAAAGSPANPTGAAACGAAPASCRPCGCQRSLRSGACAQAATSCCQAVGRRRRCCARQRHGRAQAHAAPECSPAGIRGRRWWHHRGAVPTRKRRQWQRQQEAPQVGAATGGCRGAQRAARRRRKGRRRGRRCGRCPHCSQAEAGRRKRGAGAGAGAGGRGQACKARRQVGTASQAAQCCRQHGGHHPAPQEGVRAAAFRGGALLSGCTRLHACLHSIPAIHPPRCEPSSPLRSARCPSQQHRPQAKS